MNLTSVSRRFVPLTVALLALAPSNAAAQRGGRAQGPVAPPTIVGTWAGTATIPLKDSTIVVPVTYTFADGKDGITGSAMVPGQGTGPISNVVRDGSKVQFRVTATQGVLEHEGQFGTDGAIEGMVNLNKLPVAKFRITPVPQRGRGGAGIALVSSTVIT